MNLRHESLEPLAQQFWTDTGLPDSFPRPIERAVSRSLPLTIVKLPEVTVRHIEQYLTQRGLSGPLPQDNRDMMGCLFAYRGHGIIFVCGGDDAAEQRFTIAHDAAHFMMDYLVPRETIIRELGGDVVDILDGHRPATIAERGMALLRQVRLGPHVHILPRGSLHDCASPCDGSFDSQFVQPAEDGADALGLELVAPRQVVLAMMKQFARDYPRPEHQCDLLGAFFGLPPHVFAALLRRLRPKRVPSFLEHAAAKLGKRISIQPSQDTAPPFVAGQGGHNET
jgi:hypothetical protein